MRAAPSASRGNRQENDGYCRLSILLFHEGTLCLLKNNIIRQRTVELPPTVYLKTTEKYRCSTVPTNVNKAGSNGLNPSPNNPAHQPRVEKAYLAPRKSAMPHSKRGVQALDPVPLPIKSKYNSSKSTLPLLLGGKRLWRTISVWGHTSRRHGKRAYCVAAQRLKFPVCSSKEAAKML